MTENGTISPEGPSGWFDSPGRFRVVVGVLVLAAAVLRLWDLGGVPPGLFRDEAEKGYTALELWKTGRHGEFTPAGVVPSSFLPAFIEAGGVRTSGIYQYLSAPIVGVFGLNRATTRLVAALAGLGTVLLGMMLAGRIATGATTAFWRAPRVAEKSFPEIECVAALAFLAVSPTHVLFSRWAQQGITVPMFFTAGVLLVLAVPDAREKHRRALAALAGLCFAAAFYAYAPARLVVPLALLALWAEMGRDAKRLVRSYWPAAAVFFLFAIPVFWYSATHGSGRFARISIFADQPFLGGLAQFISNYARHFDPRFLFFMGDANPRHGMAWSGLLAWAETPFFLLGVFAPSSWRRPGFRLLVLWMLAAPVAASLTNDGIPHALRAILLFPAVHLLSARGVGVVAEWIGGRAAIGLLGLAASATLVLTMLGLKLDVARNGPAWQYGVLEALERMHAVESPGPSVLSAEVPYAHYYVLFFEQPDPTVFHEEGGDVFETMILPPGAPLRPGAIVARPAQGLFGRAGGIDVPALSGDPEAPPAMQIRGGW